MIDLSKYKDKVYDDNNYNCLHFAVDLYRDLTGNDLGLFVGEAMTGTGKRTINPTKFKQLTKLKIPLSPCLAIMHGAEAHAGIYHDNIITHFNESGINNQPPHIAQLKHGRITYYAI